MPVTQGTCIGLDPVARAVKPEVSREFGADRPETRNPTGMGSDSGFRIKGLPSHISQKLRVWGLPGIEGLNRDSSLGSCGCVARGGAEVQALSAASDTYLLRLPYKCFLYNSVAGFCDSDLGFSGNLYGGSNLDSCLQPEHHVPCSTRSLISNSHRCCGCSASAVWFMLLISGLRP